MKKIKVKVRYIFEGTYTVKADSIEKAEEMVTKECGLVMGGGIHTVLDDDEVDWNFEMHPNMEIVSSEECGKKARNQHNLYKP